MKLLAFVWHAGRVCLFMYVTSNLLRRGEVSHPPGLPSSSPLLTKNEMRLFRFTENLTTREGYISYVEDVSISFILFMSNALKVRLLGVLWIYHPYCIFIQQCVFNGINSFKECLFKTISYQNLQMFCQFETQQIIQCNRSHIFDSSWGFFVIDAGSFIEGYYLLVLLHVACHLHILFSAPRAYLQKWIFRWGLIWREGLIEVGLFQSLTFSSKFDQRNNIICSIN